MKIKSEYIKILMIILLSGVLIKYRFRKKMLIILIPILVIVLYYSFTSNKLIENLDCPYGFWNDSGVICRQGCVRNDQDRHGDQRCKCNYGIPNQDCAFGFKCVNNSCVNDVINCNPVWNDWTFDKNTGVKSRTLNTLLTQNPIHGGTACPSSPQTEKYAVTCEVGPKVYQDCNKETGLKPWTKEILVQERNSNGDIIACSQATSGEDPCPVVCEVGEKIYQDCNKATGLRPWTKNIIYQERNANGQQIACSQATSGEDPCPVVCEVGEKIYQDCDKATGLKPWTKNIIFQERNANGQQIACSQATSGQDPCPVVCEVGEKIYQNCNKSTGKKAWTKNILIQERNNNGQQIACSKATTGEDPCAVKCEVGEKIYQDCNKATGKKAWTKNIIFDERNANGQVIPCTEATSGQDNCAVDCEVTEKQYDACDKALGLKKWTRSIKYEKRDNNGNIMTCPIPLNGSEPCPVECEVSNWVDSPCNQGTGRYLRNRSLLVSKRDSSGKEISCEKPLEEQKTCSTQCLVSPWISDPCNDATGRYIRKRNITQVRRNAAGQEITCEKPLQEEMTCATQCKTSPWTSTACNQATGRYMMNRTRTQEKRNAAGQIIPCEKPLQEEMTCPTQCLVSPWTSEPCNQATGRYRMTRKITQKKRNQLGQEITCEKPLQEEMTCPTQCLVSPWTSEPCNQETGRYRMTRKITQKKRNQLGQEIPCEKPLQEEKRCSTDCITSEWDNSPCEEDSGSYIKTRRIVQKKRNTDGEEIPCEKPLKQTVGCSTECKVSPWISEPCNESTGKYMKKRTIIQKKRDTFGNVIPCEKPLEEEATCATECKVSEWVNGPCDENTGIFIKRRDITQKRRNAAGQVIPCEKPLQEEGTCEVECKVSDWTFSNCDSETGKMKKERNLLINRRDPEGKVIPCEKPLTGVDNCSVECKVGEWKQGECNKKIGVRTNTRDIITQKINMQGERLPCEIPLTEEEPCPVKCSVSDWSNGNCNERIGLLTKTRKVLVDERDAQGRVIPCSEELMEEEFCPVSCKVSEWIFGKCNQQTGKVTKTRKVILPERDNKGNIIKCPQKLTEDEKCNVDCKVYDWSQPVCDRITGIQTRVRKVDQPFNDGKRCPPESELMEMQQCQDTLTAEEKRCYWKDPKYCIFNNYTNNKGLCKPNNNSGKGEFKTNELTVDEFKKWLKERSANESENNEVYNYWEKCKNLPGYEFLKSENYIKKEIKQEEEQKLVIHQEEQKPVIHQEEQKPIKRIIRLINNEALLRPNRDIDYSFGYDDINTDMRYYYNGDINNLVNNYVI